MHVLINQDVTFGARTGIGHYTRELLRELHALAEPGTIDTFPTGLLAKARRLTARFHRPRGAASLQTTTRSPGILSRCRRRLIAAARPVGRMVLGRLFQRQCRLGKYDLYHEPNFIGYPTDLPTLVTLHDLSVVLHPEWHPADRVAMFHKQFERTVRQACHFFAISESARQEIIRVLGVPPERITCTYMGVRAGLRPMPTEVIQAELARLGLPPRYLLCVGTIEPRKNILRLLKLYCSLPASYRDAWPLVLVGGWGWNTDEVANYFQSHARHQGVIHVGYLPDEQLPTLYNGARALVFPSYYEGFGLPPVEMLACGGAVLASTAAAVAETVGHHAHLIAPEDDDGWRHALERVLVDDDWWRSLRHGAVEAAAKFTWRACAERTLGLYRQLCDHPLSQRRAA